MLHLEEKETYYVLMESGVATGFDFCGPESPPIFDPYLWRVSISIAILTLFLGKIDKIGLQFKKYKYDQCIYAIDKTAPIHHDVSSLNADLS